MVPQRKREHETFTPELVLAYREALSETQRLQHEALRTREARSHLHLVLRDEGPELRSDISWGYTKSLIGRALIGLCMSLSIAAMFLAWRAFVMTLEAL